MVSHRLDFVWAEFRAIHACLNFWHLGGAPASGAGPPPRLFGGTSQAIHEVLCFPQADYRTLTLAHLEGVCDRGLPLVVLIPHGQFIGPSR